MFAICAMKRFRFLVAGGALLFAMGCAQQTVKTDESVAQPTPRMEKPAAPRPATPMAKEESMTERERARRRADFKSALASFEDDLIYFDFDKSVIRPDMRGILDRKAQFLLEYPSLRIQVEGHCDERGTVQYNIALGHRRAQSSKDYLASLGVAASRVDTVSYGEERPLDPRRNERAWAKNRRARFNVIGGIPAGMN